jgi:hypothetical protein
MKRKSRKYSFLDELDLSNVQKSRISLILGNAERGNKTVILSPYNRTTPGEAILGRWFHLISNYLDSGNLKNLESLNFLNSGPRSIAIPWGKRKASVLAYYQHTVNAKTTSVASLRPFKSDNVKQRRLRPLSLATALTFLKPDTNAGLPFMIKKKDVKEEVINNFTYYIDRKDPCCLFTRTQEQRKTRNVWGFPIADTLNEMRYYRPLLNYQKSLNWRSSLNGPDAVNARLRELIRLAQQQDEYVVSVDFSSYDATLVPELQAKAFQYIKYLFQKSFSDGLDYIEKRFKSIGLITPDGIYTGEHGVPSGSTFTNEVDSIIQFLIAKDFGIPDGHFDIQGDDGIYVTSDPNGLLNHFEKYGLIVNREKTYISKDFAVYLQLLFDREIDVEINGIYPTVRALNRILFPERFVDINKLGIDGKSYFSIRTICILENCKYHPCFESFVDFVLSLDKYRLDFDDLNLNKYVKYFERRSSIKDILVYREEDNPKGIRNFRTYTYLLKKREDIS